MQSVQIINVKQQDRTFEGQIWSETSERNALYFENVTVTYTISGVRAPWICANVTDWKQTLVDTGIVASAVKAAAKEFSPTDVTNRTLVEPRVQELLQDSMDKKYGVDTVFINAENPDGVRAADSQPEEHREGRGRCRGPAHNRAG